MKTKSLINTVKTLANLLVVIAMAHGAIAWAAPSTLQIDLSDESDDGERLIIATVTQDGRPLEDIKVEFGVVRSFGVMVLATDTTLDDGTAAADFPVGLPGDEAGRLSVVARISATTEYEGASATALFGGAPSVASVDQPIPHALWSARPLWPLVIVIGILGGIVWTTFGVVVVFLLKIFADRKEVTQ